MTVLVAPHSPRECERLLAANINGPLTIITPSRVSGLVSDGAASLHLRGGQWTVMDVAISGDAASARIDCQARASSHVVGFIVTWMVLMAAVDAALMMTLLGPIRAGELDPLLATAPAIGLAVLGFTVFAFMRWVGRDEEPMLLDFVEYVLSARRAS